MSRDLVRQMLGRYLEMPVSSALARTPVTPTHLTLTGLALAGAAAYLASSGRLAAAGGLLVASGLFDLLDGSLARKTGRVTRGGGLLDSVSDRLGEAGLLLGLLVFYVVQPDTAGVVLAYLALVGSFLVSYVRARAEGLGADATTGLMTRPERIAVLATALVLGHWWQTAVLVGLGLIAAVGLVTALARMANAMSQLREG